MLQVSWSRSKVGEQPRVLLGDHCILLHYTVARGHQQVTELVCFDFNGRELWSQQGRRGLLSLSGDRFLVTTPEGEPLIVNGSGRIMRRWRAGGIEQVIRHGDLLLLAGVRHVWATDLMLNRLWSVTWPGEHPAIDCFVDDSFYILGENEIRVCHLDGHSEPFCSLPQDLIAGTIEHHIQTAIISSEQRQFLQTSSLSAFYWRLSFDEKHRQFFLSNFLPHLILCLDLSGQPRWCKYLCPSCCGGRPYVMPNGLYVASSGCGGILSWLDLDGNILFRSQPHEGVGLATAYSNDLVILPDGRILVDGGPGVVIYNSEGDLLQVFERWFCQFHCHPVKRLLVGCYGHNNENNPPSVCLELASGL